MENSLKIMIGALIYVSILIYLYLTKIKEIKAESYEHSLCLPICKTIANFVDATDKIETIIPVIENTQFRSMTVIIFDMNGEIWADSRQISEGKLPLPASEWQQSIFKSIVRDVVSMPAGIIKPIFQNCSPKSSKHDTAFVSAVHLETKKKIVVVFQCGIE